MRRWLIVGGVILILLGALWPVLRRIGLGRLPGDIVIQRPGFSFYFPITTCLILSVILSIIVWLLRR
jgi:membrane protein implicated in regulation of membrane protease activity